MNKNFKVQAQGGFTLIELIVVIVILGILAATALPKFANLGGDARLASLNAAKGAMASASAVMHGKILVNPAAVVSNQVTVEGSAVDCLRTAIRQPPASPPPPACRRPITPHTPKAAAPIARPWALALSPLCR